MELDSLFSMPRWRILEILAVKPSSPLQISGTMGTSVAYVSQQLKLLEAAGIIVKERIKGSEKGKARHIYSLKNELVHFTALLKGCPIRKSMTLSEHQKIILKIWLLANGNFNYLLEKFFWNIEEDLNEIKAIFVDISSSNLKILVVSDSKKIRQKSESFLRKAHSFAHVDITCAELLNRYPSEGYFAIHNPQNLKLGSEKVKGGDDKIVREKQ